MSSFIGTEIYSLDSKGRVSLPSKMRKEISPEANETFILTTGFENCIMAFPYNFWKPYEERIRKINIFEEEARLFRRYFGGGGDEVKLDSQQRISIPKKFIEELNLKSKVTIVGQFDYIEIWDPEEYKNYMKNAPMSYADAAKKVMSNSYNHGQE